MPSSSLHGQTQCFPGDTLVHVHFSMCWPPTRLSPSWIAPTSRPPPLAVTRQPSRTQRIQACVKSASPTWQTTISPPTQRYVHPSTCCVSSNASFSPLSFSFPSRRPSYPQVLLWNDRPRCRPQQAQRSVRASSSPSEKQVRSSLNL